MIQNYMSTEYTKQSTPVSTPEAARPLPEYDSSQGQKEYNTGKKAAKKIRKATSLMAQMSAVLLSVVLVKDGFGEDILSANPFAGAVSEPVISATVIPGGEPTIAPVNPAAPTPTVIPDVIKEQADLAFPSLPNLAIDTQVGEAFISVKNVDTNDDYTLYNQIAPDQTVSAVGNITYDEATNTLNLDNVSGNYAIFVNLMGNSFKVNVKGENHIATLVVYGFHYGGSVLLTGDGTLYINEDMAQEYGIHVEGEYSPSCLMIDNGVKLHASGYRAAVMVHASTLDQGIYYLAPLSLRDGLREWGIYETRSISGRTDESMALDYTFVDDNGYVRVFIDIE